MEQLKWWYMFHLIPVLVILGLIANVTAVVFLLRRRFRGLNTTVYLLVLATNNTLFLLVNSWEYQHYVYSDTELDWPSVKCCPEQGQACVLHLVLRMTAVWINNWIIAHAMVDRLLYACLTRQRYYNICTQGTALTVCLLTIVVNFLKKIRFILSVISPDCTDNAVHDMGVEEQFDGTLLPGVVVIVCLVVVTCYLPCVDLKRDHPPETAAKAADTFLLTRLVLVLVVLHLLLSVSMQLLDFVIQVTNWSDLVIRAPYLIALFIIIPAVHHALTPFLFITTTLC